MEAEEEEPAGRLLFRQFLAMVRLSLRRSLRSKTIWSLIGMAMPAIGIAVIFAAVTANFSGFTFADPLRENAAGMPGDGTSSYTHEVFRAMYVGAYLHFGLIFAAIMFGNSALREEMDEQTLHYLYLQPMPRWLMMLGKYTAFLLLAAPIFMISMICTRLILLIPYGPTGFSNVLFSLEFVGRFLTEAAVMLLALSIYAAIFLALSNIFKNVVYALFIYGWEAATNFLPAALKDFSIAYYLKNMLPAASLERPGAIATLTEGPGVLQTVLVLSLVWAGALVFTGVLANWKQCLYGTTTT